MITVNKQKDNEVKVPKLSDVVQELREWIEDTEYTTSSEHDIYAIAGKLMVIKDALNNII